MIPKADIAEESKEKAVANLSKYRDHTLVSGVYPKLLKAGPSKKKLNQWEDLSDLEDMDTMDQQVNRTNE
uniref:Uncharacterized protein n=1 Tax=Romanomermis culicivorax TaxID=13658 RepID=A0A915IMF6_ROMCU